MLRPDPTFIAQVNSTFLQESGDPPPFLLPTSQPPQREKVALLMPLKDLQNLAWPADPALKNSLSLQEAFHYILGSPPPPPDPFRNYLQGGSGLPAFLPSSRACLAPGHNGDSSLPCAPLEE